MDTSAARESCSSVDVACRFGCCALLVRARPSRAASTSNDGRGVCPAGFLPLEVVAAADHAPSYPRPAHPVHVRSAAKRVPQLRQRVSVPTVGLWQMCFITRTCRSRLISCENTSRPFLALVRGTGT